MIWIKVAVFLCCLAFAGYATPKAEEILEPPIWVPIGGFSIAAAVFSMCWLLS